MYYIPDAHGAAWRKGTPVLQYDVVNRTHKVIAFLNNVYESKYGYRLGGTYALDLDDEGKRLFINMNAVKNPSGSDSGFGDPVLVVVNIPASEAPHVTASNPLSTPVSKSPHLGLEATAVTDTSSKFINDRSGLPSHTVAKTAPTVDFVPFPLAHNNGNPWSSWGAGLYASNGRFYAAIGDHLATNGNSYLYEYNPDTKKLKAVGDIHDATNHKSGTTGHGKVHGQINEANDGFIYMVSYWGSKRGVVFDSFYKGSVILRYPVR